MKWLALWCVATVAAAGEVTPATSLPLIREVLELRLEVYRQGIEFQDWKILHLDEDLRLALSEQRRAVDDERSALEELTSPDPESESGARRADVDRELPRIRELQRSRQQRVAELNDKLVRERNRRQSLIQLAEEAAGRLRELGRSQAK